MFTANPQSPLASIGNLQRRPAISVKPTGMAEAGIAADSGAPLPVFDLAPFVGEHSTDGSHDGDHGRAALAAGIANSLHETGCCVVRDPRVLSNDNHRFLDMMERYFQQSTEEKMQDARPALHYQVGVTPEGVEVPKAAHDAAVQAQMRSQPEGHRATPLDADSGADPKWRFMARMGDRPTSTEFAELNAEPVIPAGFPEWTEVTDGWGNKVLGAVCAVAELAAEGFGLPRTAFSDLMQLGPHLLAPTGADLEKHGCKGKVIAGFHSDLNFLTIHGKSRFPGLFVWLRSGQRIPVRIPDGCLIVQAGKQMEVLTGGYVKAGMHEVMCSDAMMDAIATARQAARPLWRVSSTVFAHCASDKILEPLGKFATESACRQYPSIEAGDFVSAELEGIRLKAN